MLRGFLAECFGHAFSEFHDQPCYYSVRFVSFWIVYDVLGFVTSLVMHIKNCMTMLSKTISHAHKNTRLYAEKYLWTWKWKELKHSESKQNQQNDLATRRLLSSTWRCLRSWLKLSTKCFKITSLKLFRMELHIAFKELITLFLFSCTKGFILLYFDGNSSRNQYSRIYVTNFGFATLARDRFCITMRNTWLNWKNCFILKEWPMQ